MANRVVSAEDRPKMVTAESLSRYEECMHLPWES